MGCLKLTYGETYTALKVVQGGLYGVEKGCADGYRYGFNGKEKESEIGEGVYDFGAREYDSRLGRMFTPDPREREYPWQSTYAYFANSPIFKLDFNGEGDGDGAKLSKNSALKVSTTKTSASGHVYNGKVDMQDKDGKGSVELEVVSAEAKASGNVNLKGAQGNLSINVKTVKTTVITNLKHADAEISLEGGTAEAELSGEVNVKKGMSVKAQAGAYAGKASGEAGFTFWGVRVAVNAEITGASAHIGASSDLRSKKISVKANVGFGLGGGVGFSITW